MAKKQSKINSDDRLISLAEFIREAQDKSAAKLHRIISIIENGKVSDLKEEYPDATDILLDVVYQKALFELSNDLMFKQVEGMKPSEDVKESLDYVNKFREIMIKKVDKAIKGMKIVFFNPEEIIKIAQQLEKEKNNFNKPFTHS